MDKLFGKTKNKRANIPVTILVLGIVMLCGLIIFSFYFGSNQTIKDISDVSVIEKVKVNAEKFDFYMEKIEFTEEEIIEILEIKESEEYGRHFIGEKGNLRVIYPLG